MSNDIASQIVEQALAPAQAEPKQEAQAPEAPAPKDEKISNKLEILIRREQQALAREQAAKQKESEIEAKLRRIEEFESAKGNSKKALELLGLDYNQLTESLMKDGEIPVDVKLKAIEDKFDSFKTAQEQAEQKQKDELKRQAELSEQKAVTDFKSEITQYIEDNSSRYEFIKFHGQQELVYDVVDKHYQRTMDESTGVGKVMSITEACDKVEEYLEKQYDESKKLSKAQALWSAVPKKTLTEAAKPQTSLNKPQTLTNKLAASAPLQTPKRPSEDQRVQGILAQFLATKGQRAQ